MSAKINMPRDYQDAERLLKGYSTAKIGHNTGLRMDTERDADGKELRVISVQYHATKIIRLFPDGTWETRNGGFFTSTTKARIADFLSYHGLSLYQEKHIWYIVPRSASYDRATRRALRVEYPGFFASADKAALGMEHASKE